jgi:hypothetical protein
MPVSTLGGRDGERPWDAFASVTSRPTARGLPGPGRGDSEYGGPGRSSIGCRDHHAGRCRDRVGGDRERGTRRTGGHRHVRREGGGGGGATAGKSDDRASKRCRSGQVHGSRRGASSGHGVGTQVERRQRRECRGYGQRSGPCHPFVGGGNRDARRRDDGARRDGEGRARRPGRDQHVGGHRGNRRVTAREHDKGALRGRGPAHCRRADGSRPSQNRGRIDADRRKHDPTDGNASAEDANAGLAVVAVGAGLPVRTSAAISPSAIGIALVVVPRAILAVAVTQEVAGAEVPIPAFVGAALGQHAVRIGEVDQPVAIIVAPVEAPGLEPHAHAVVIRAIDEAVTVIIDLVCAIRLENGAKARAREHAWVLRMCGLRTHCQRRNEDRR